MRPTTLKICFINSNVHLIQKHPHKHTQNNVWFPVRPFLANLPICSSTYPYAACFLNFPLSGELLIQSILFLDKLYLTEFSSVRNFKVWMCHMLFNHSVWWTTQYHFYLSSHIIVQAIFASKLMLGQESQLSVARFFRISPSKYI